MQHTGSYKGTYTPLRAYLERDGSTGLYAEGAHEPLWIQRDGKTTRVGAVDELDHGVVLSQR